MKEMLTCLILTMLIAACGESGNAKKENVSLTDTSVAVEEFKQEDDGLVELEEDVAPTPEILTVFLKFRDAVLKQDTVLLKQLILGKVKEDGGNTLSATEIIHELDAPQLMVLEKRTDWAFGTDTDAQQAGCVYRDFFNSEDIESEFSWSVGCVHLVDGDVGEYSTVFLFKKEKGIFRLSEMLHAN